MRIISGWAKGRKLHPPSARSHIIRPTSDRAREALFSILGDRTKGASVLDLFAGSGALGLEALSRGAKSICFVDYHPQALELIKRNIQICMDAFQHQPGIYNESSNRHCNEPLPVTLIKHDLRRGLPMFSRNIPLLSGFDLIFLDPPYSQGLSTQLLHIIDHSSLLRPHGLLVVEDRAKETLPSRLDTLVLTDQRKYGEAGFWFYQLLPDASTS